MLDQISCVSHKRRIPSVGNELKRSASLKEACLHNTGTSSFRCPLSLVYMIAVRNDLPVRVIRPGRVHSGSRSSTQSSYGMKSDHILYRYHVKEVRGFVPVRDKWPSWRGLVSFPTVHRIGWNWFLGVSGVYERSRALARGLVLIRGFPGLFCLSRSISHQVNFLLCLCTIRC